MKGWKEIPIGGMIVEAGNAMNYKTGTWRSIRPVWSESKCTNCMMCWISCPDSSIMVKDGKMVGIDYDYCKGCGVCSQVCPVKAIEMKPELDFIKKEGE